MIRHFNDSAKQTITKQGWLILGVFATITTLFILWTIKEVVSLNVQGKGVVISSEKSSHDLFVYALFPPNLGKNIKKGSILRFRPEALDPDYSGALLSRVTAVFGTFIFKSPLSNDIENEDISKLLSDDIFAVQVVAELIKSKDDPSQYMWSLENVASFDPTPGLMGSAEVTLESIHPIAFLFPDTPSLFNSFSGED